MERRRRWTTITIKNKQKTAPIGRPLFSAVVSLLLLLLLLFNLAQMTTYNYIHTHYSIYVVKYMYTRRARSRFPGIVRQVDDVS